ncbi:MBL fold metallo-hydrolase [bacterium]|nr:MBL fold metallo-hydrolase [bacterium]MBU1064967.1 MBL fold metallo-hydrolase [bacterium]MBU1635009.1 MBL fold metallo-hydrolase [bacterium]MBU1872735.1 MBL fold metallo-hydrolase [bacterium]
MLSIVKWLGHATLLFKAEKIIYIDPYQLKGNPQKADLILITHDHYDHLSKTDIDKIRTDETIIVVPASSKQSLPGTFRTINIGDTLTFGNISIEAVPSYNTNKNFHPKNARNVGYILTINNIRYYHAGDTDIIPEMEDFNVDVAFLPIGGTYTMTPEEAAEAVRLIKPKIAVPIHYNSIVGSIADAKTFEKLCKCPVKILPQGE